MASLTNVSITTRRIIRYGFYTIVLILVIKIAINIGTSIYRKFVPAPPPPPTLAFGKLTKIPFPEIAQPQNLSYDLQTPDGKLPKLDVQLPVYFMPKATSNIRALDIAKEKVRRLGFNPNGRELVETVYLFNHTSTPSTLNMNIVTGIFSISYDLNSDPSILSATPPSPEVAIKLAQNKLSAAQIKPEDLDGPTSTEFIKVQEGKFTNALSLSEANIIKVNLFRKSYNNIVAVGPKYKEANVWFMFSGSPNNKGNQIIAGEYHYFPIQADKNGTYPLITPQTAWDSLQEGKGYIVNIDSDHPSTIPIRKIYLAYYDAGQYTDFYQPVIVFEGDYSFEAYIPAVTSDYYPE